MHSGGARWARCYLEMLRWRLRDYPRPDDPDDNNRKLLEPVEKQPAEY